MPTAETDNDTPVPQGRHPHGQDTQLDLRELLEKMHDHYRRRTENPPPDRTEATSEIRRLQHDPQDGERPPDKGNPPAEESPRDEGDSPDEDVPPF